ncbi:MAG: hypothetical protein ABIW81_06475 [Terrimesophilobacter sp.]
MSENTRPQVVRSYLSQLDVALDGVPGRARRAILDGAAEELEGLDAASAAQRIEELGDPEFIAAAARAESGVVADVAGVGGIRATPSPAGTDSSAVTGHGAPAALAASPANRRSGDARWYIVLSSLLVAFGGVVVPLLGWVFGLAMVWVSKSWRLWEKWVATLTPPITIAFSVLMMGVVRGASDSQSSEGANPLLPSMPDSLFSNLFLLVGLNAVVGIWLLWRGLRGTHTQLT